ncbi:sensor protein ZraS, partial [Staphylococcus aureus]|nr:sensor protein ZraS [Staphylococcus aureus]
RPPTTTSPTGHIKSLTRHSVAVGSQAAQSRGIALQFSPRPGLTTSSSDPDRLNQVLLNLYLNAMQAIGRDGVIRVTASEADRQRVKIVVTDSGKGMTDEELPAIFTPYVTTQAGRTVPGRAVVPTIIEQPGGATPPGRPPGAGPAFSLRVPGGRP